ncbi:Zn-ribbon domain-containing OB-fold protein [Mycobacterium saskatchewanense]|uniref:Zn-ribbon domain-containing OB-fold protein n=1 Tax=Mycobacterium saskatchewanense TaxID=220927 RepID=UPI0018D75249|nr:OB-fold domain-containing protein [Mycobacterium saskatchewanense]
MPNELSAAFWNALEKDGKLTVPECVSCGGRFFVPEPLCPYCGSGDWRWVNSQGIGSVYSFTVVHQTVSPDQPTPFVLAIVELDDGWSMLTHVVDCEVDSVHVGTKVRVSPRRYDNGATLPTFVLAE